MNSTSNGHIGSSGQKGGTHSSELMGEEEEETLRICYNHIGVHFSCYVAAHPHLNSISTHNNHNNSSNDIQANHSNKSHTSTSNHPHPHPHEVNGPLLVVSPGIWHHLVVSVDYTENSSHKTDQKQGANDAGATHRDAKVGDLSVYEYD